MLQLQQRRGSPHTWSPLLVRNCPRACACRPTRHTNKWVQCHKRTWLFDFGGRYVLGEGLVNEDGDIFRAGIANQVLGF